MQKERSTVPSAPIPEPSRSTFLRRFLVQVVLLVAAFAAAGFTAVYLRTQFLLEERSLAQARSTVDLIVAVPRVEHRLWGRLGGKDPRSRDESIPPQDRSECRHPNDGRARPDASEPRHHDRRNRRTARRPRRGDAATDGPSST